MKKIIIFGDKDIAELAHYYLTEDAHKTIECFTVHGKYLTNNSFCSKPVIPFEELVKTHSPEEYDFFAPIYHPDMNRTKEKICNEIKSHGYKFISYISSKANTWNAKIGENCFIFEGCNIQPFCTIGDNLVMWSYSHIGHHSIVEDNVFISGLCAIAGHNKICKYSWMGSNCTTREHTVIPEGTMIAQDASVVKSPTEPWGIWCGVPAKYLRSSCE